jgi:hypothetical protein
MKPERRNVLADQARVARAHADKLVRESRELVRTSRQVIEDSKSLEDANGATVENPPQESETRHTSRPRRIPSSKGLTPS